MGWRMDEGFEAMSQWRGGWCRKCVLLGSLLVPLVGRGHVGSPNVFFEGKAGAYSVRVTIRPPAVLPGSVQVDIRAEDPTVTNVTLQARLFDAAALGKQPSVQATKVVGETNFFNGVLWLLRNGSYRVHVTLEGDKGNGVVSIPLNSAAIQEPVMNPLWKGALIGLGVILFLGAVWIAGAVARDYRLDSGAPPLRGDWTRGLAVAGIVAVALGGGAFTGTARWRAMD